MYPFEALGESLELVPHVTKHAERAAMSLYLTPEHVSQGCIQIRGSPRCHYMRYSSQNPKAAKP
jgi:hypothetical protein